MAHEGLWEQLETLDQTTTAKRAKCRSLSNPERYIVNLLNTEYVINLSDRNIFPLQRPDESAGFIEQLCLLAYLINSQDLPLANDLIGAESLPGGQFFFRGQHGLPTGKLEKTFGNRHEDLYQASVQFGAEKCEFGDASIRLYVLPRAPLTIVIWQQCEEFDARASILFDKTAPSQLPLDALLAAVNLTVDELISNATEN